MSTIALWSIINNEMDFLPLIIPFHLNWIDKWYVLDTGSVDGSWEFLQAYAAKEPKLVVEKYHTSYTPDYSKAWEEVKNPFPESEVRNFAIAQVEKLNTDWLIQIDGDEVFTPNTKKVIEKNNNAMVIAHSTINPVCPLSHHPIETRRGIKLFDPHARIWRSKQGFKYFKNPAFNNEKDYHCIPGFSTLGNGKVHLYHHTKTLFLPDIMHLHLHWIFGKKLESFYANKGIITRQDIVAQQKLNELSLHLPREFWDRRKNWINYEC
jgi:glycosyltransferase involved in cell wall biosynthesis